MTGEEVSGWLVSRVAASRGRFQSCLAMAGLSSTPRSHCLLRPESNPQGVSNSLLVYHPRQLLIWNRPSSFLLKTQLPGHMPSRAASCWRRCGRRWCSATQIRSFRRPQKGDRGQGFLWERAGGRRRPPAWLCGAFRPAKALPRSLARGRSWRGRGRLGGAGGRATCGLGEPARR